MYKFKYMSDSFEFINKFKFQIKKFKEHNITPIYVFDGVHPQLKQEIKESRKLVKTISITKEDIANLKELLVDNNVTFLIAPSEGEKFCAYLNSIDYVDYVLSNDYDTLLFNCKKLLTYTNRTFNLLDTQDILTHLNISLKQLIDIGIASGCDYHCAGIKGFGIKKSLDFSLKHPNDFFDNFECDFNVNEIKALFNDFTQEKQLFETL